MVNNQKKIAAQKIVYVDQIGGVVIQIDLLDFSCLSLRVNGQFTYN